MSGKIPAGEFNTRFTIDGSQPVETLKQIKSEVSSLTAGWKAQAAQLKSAGDAVGAAQAKYDGLSNAISKQQGYINRLAAEQKQLDTSTNDGAQSYAKLERQIATATTRLNSMTAQQDRAKQSLAYQKSGLAELQTQYRQITQTSESYVNRLQAEGKVQEANTAKMSEYRKAISNLDSQLRSQESELSRIASESGKASDAYKRQEVHVNETATALAKTKTSMNELNESMRKANPSIFDKIKTHIVSTNKETEKGSGLLKKFVAGGVISNAISNGWSTFTSAVKDTVKSGLELNEAGEAINHTWENMGKNGDQIKQLDTQMSDLRAKTGDTAGQINVLQRTVDNLTHGDTAQTLTITQGIAAIGTASHMSGEQTDGFAKSMVRVASSGTITTSSLARLEKQAPTLSASLAKAAGVSQAQFAKMVDGGKVSSQTFMQLLAKIGKTSNTTFTAFGKTAEGAQAQISGGWQTLKAKMTAPLLDVKNSGMTSLASILTSSVVQGAATSLGKAVANLAAKGEEMLDYIGKHKSDVTGIMSDLGQIAKIAAETVWDTFKGIVTTVAQGLGLSGKNADAFKNPLGTIHAVLNDIVKNRSGIQTTVKTILALFAVKKALDFAVGVSRVYDALKKLSTIKSLGGGIGSITNGSKLGGFGQSIKSAGGLKGLTTAGKIGTGLAGAGVALDAGSSIVSAFKDKGGSTKQYQDAGKGIGSAIGGGIGLYFGGPLGAALGAKIGGWIGKWGGTGAKSFMNGWNKAGKGKKPSDWLGKIGFDAHQGATGIGKWWSGLQKENAKDQKRFEKDQEKENKQAQKNWNSFWKSVSKGWNGFWSGVSKANAKGQKARLKQQQQSNKTISKNWNSFWKTAGKDWNGFWSNVSKANSKGQKARLKQQTQSNKTISKNWNSFWSTTSKNWNGFWSGANKTTNKWWNTLSKGQNSWWSSASKGWNSWWSNTSKGWDSFWSGVSKNSHSWMGTLSKNLGSWWSTTKSNWGSFWSSVNKNGSNAMSTMHKYISDGLSKVHSGWHSMWSGLGTWMGHVWSGIKNGARDGMNGVIGIINGAIKGINWVWSKFTGHNALHQISRLANGGVVGKMHMVMVNDGVGNNWKELFQLPNGAMGMFHDRNHVSALPEGTRVYNGDETKQIMSAAGIEHYDLGGVIGGVGKALSGAWDKLKTVGDWIAHPIEHVSELIHDAVKGMSAGTSMFNDLAGGVVNKLISNVASWMKKNLKSIQGKLEAQGVAGQPKQAQAWLPIVEKLMKQMGANPPNGIASEAAAFVREIGRESGGNPTIRQTVWDVNMANGNPAQGLLQFIPSTFMAYAVPGHTNILNGEDQIMATINAYMHSGGWNRIGTGENINFLANGGIATIPSIVGEAGAESVIPLSAIKSSRSYEMLGQTAAILAARDNVQQQSTDAPASNAQMLKLMQQNNDLVQMIITLITPKMTSNDNQKDVPLNQALQVLVNKISQIQHNTAYQTRRTGGARA